MMLVRIGRCLSFARRVLSAFRANRGLLLSGGVAYNALLSALPLLAVAASGLSLVIDPRVILKTIRAELGHLVPRHADAVAEAVEAFFAHRDLVGVVGFIGLLFFSSIGFRMLDQAIRAIFSGSAGAAQRVRRRWREALMPYVAIVALGAVLLLLIVIAGGLEALAGSGRLQIGGWHASLEATTTVALRLVAFAGQLMLFALIYRLVPPVDVSWPRALLTGLVVGVTWDLIARALGYYFAHLSLVDLVYGSLATVVVLLLGLEVATILLLLGAQALAELHASAEAGVAWHADPRAERSDR